MKKKNNAPEKRNVKIVHAVATVEVPIAPRKFKSKQKTLKEWLFAICDGDKPEKSIEEFVIGFGIGREITKRSSRDYVTFKLYGVNRYRNDTYSEDTHIEFSPPNMHFKTSKTEYENIDWPQLKNKVSLQLKEILFTERVKSSFLAAASFISFSFNGERVLLK
jgi:hypothetical protein